MYVYIWAMGHDMGLVVCMNFSFAKGSHYILVILLKAQHVSSNDHWPAMLLQTCRFHVAVS